MNAAAQPGRAGRRRRAPAVTLRRPLAMLLGLGLVACRPRLDNDIRPEITREYVRVQAEGSRTDVTAPLAIAAVQDYRRLHTRQTPVSRPAAPYMLVVGLGEREEGRQIVSGRLVDMTSSVILCGAVVDVERSDLRAAVTAVVTELLRRPQAGVTRCGGS